MKTHTISVEPWVLALPRAHPLVKGKRLRLGDLKREPFVWFPRWVAPPLHDRLLSACHEAGLTLNIVQEVKSFTIRSAEKSKPDGVVLREIDDLRVTAELSAIWKEDNKVPALQKFIEVVRHQFPGIARH